MYIYNGSFTVGPEGYGLQDNITFVTGLIMSTTETYDPDPLFTLCHAVLLGMTVGGVCLPVVVALCVCCCGFECGGIRGGSRAARYMSYEAISGGGGVSSGGCVACFQSLGACACCACACCAVYGITAMIGAAAGGAIAGVIVK